MRDRAVLMISCLKEEAAKIHQEAELQRRTVSGYVLNVVMRAVKFDEKLLAEHPGIHSLKTVAAAYPIRPIGLRTAMLLRCSTEESKRIRSAAKHRDATISGFVLWSLRRSWLAALQAPGFIVGGRNP